MTPTTRGSVMGTREENGFDSHTPPKWSVSVKVAHREMRDSKSLPQWVAILKRILLNLDRIAERCEDNVCFNMVATWNKACLRQSLKALPPPIKVVRRVTLY